MGETIEKSKKQFVEFWTSIDKNKKIKLAIGSLLVLIIVTAIIIFSTRTNYVTLYQDLSQKEAGVITQKLDDKGVEWKFGEIETTILVSEEQKNKAMIDLASEGLPKEGYSVLDALNDSSWTMTEYEKKERIRYAVESQLATTISQISGIESANVLVDSPEDTAFMNTEGHSTASVFISLSDNVPISQDKIVAIKTLVSSSFKDMEKNNVNIIDDNGRSYNDTENNMGKYNLNDQLVVKQNFQNKLNESIKRFLENLFGYGNVDVRANVSMNFDREVTRIVEFNPPIEGATEGLVRSMEKIEEHTVNGNSGEVVGVEPNTEDTTDYATEDGLVSKYDKASEVINYELNEINREIKKAPGEIESVTVAILINENSIDGNLTEERKDEIQDLIYAATGLDTEEVIVNSGQFNNSIDIAKSDQTNNKSNLPIWLLALAAITLMAGTGVIVYKRRNNNEDINELLVDRYEETEEIEDIDFETEKSEYKTKINNFVDKKPESVAKLLRSWLNEE